MTISIFIGILKAIKSPSFTDFRGLL